VRGAARSAPCAHLPLPCDACPTGTLFVRNRAATDPGSPRSSGAHRASGNRGSGGGGSSSSSGGGAMRREGGVGARKQRGYCGCHPGVCMIMRPHPMQNGWWAPQYANPVAEIPGWVLDMCCTRQTPTDTLVCALACHLYVHLRVTCRCTCVSHMCRRTHAHTHPYTHTLSRTLTHTQTHKPLQNILPCSAPALVKRTPS
jgi:hypothetical protein